MFTLVADNSDRHPISTTSKLNACLVLASTQLYANTLQSSRQELIQDVDELKKKITGAAEE